MQPCTPLAAAVVEPIVVIPSAARTGLYKLLQCGEDSEYGRNAYGGYFEVFHVLLVEDGESSPPTSRNFQYVVA
jgi:glucosinolate gamma-glutamyl hydrolase